MKLTDEQRDRAYGVLLGTAVGDALGAGYEFGPALRRVPIGMIGGGPFQWEPGEWTDDTAMTVVIANVAASMDDLRSKKAQDEIVAEWVSWARKSKDVGNQTRTILDHVRRVHGDSIAAVKRAREYAEVYLAAGNGSLMRTSPIALAYLADEEGLIAAAASISALTHVDYDAIDACILWSLAIRHAILTGEANVRVGLAATTDPEMWETRLQIAEVNEPRAFRNNGWVVEALQGAWSAIHATANFENAVTLAVRGGNDTDTVAAIAGGLSGAAYGAKAIPNLWLSSIHGWPSLSADGLNEITDNILVRVEG